MFIRHPSERLLSAYRNKVEHPHNRTTSEQKIWSRIHKSIDNFRKFGNHVLDEVEVPPSFAEFIHFLFHSDSEQMNEHFKPTLSLCQPCIVKYDFVGNFATLRNDANAVLKHLHINNTLFWDRGKHVTHPTRMLVRKYYSRLLPFELREFEKMYANDIDFYYSLFASESDGEYSAVRENTLKL